MKYKLVLILLGHMHTYPFDKDSIPEKRADTLYDVDVGTAQDKCETTVGVKGWSILSHLSFYRPITSTCIDYMHSVLEGVIKNFFRYWILPKYSNSEFSLRNYISQIDKKLLKIKPPSFVPNAPRSIDEYNNWRAHEYLSFIFYYSLPIFLNIMKFEYLENLKKLVIFMEVLFSSSLTISNLDAAHKIIIEFVDELGKLYPGSILLSGVHELLHLVDCAKDFGPLFRCFPVFRLRN